MDPVIRDAGQAIERRDWDALKPLLHPYLHWTDADGRTTRGRTNVLASVSSRACAPMPASYELRDGQIYRWTEPRRDPS